jgi:hypothetical protein
VCVRVCACVREKYIDKDPSFYRVNRFTLYNIVNFE